MRATIQSQLMLSRLDRILHRKFNIAVESLDRTHNFPENGSCENLIRVWWVNRCNRFLEFFDSNEDVLKSQSFVFGVCVWKKFWAPKRNYHPRNSWEYKTRRMGWFMRLPPSFFADRNMKHPSTRLYLRALLTHANASMLLFLCIQFYTDSYV